MKCHWTHEHGPHTWYPAVEDPEEPRVLHLTFQPARCPGESGGTTIKCAHCGEDRRKVRLWKSIVALYDDVVCCRWGE